MTMTKNKVKVSPTCEITEFWTDEECPQLQYLEVTHVTETQSFTVKVDADSLGRFLVAIQRTYVDMKVQEVTKKRAKKGKEGKP